MRLTVAAAAALWLAPVLTVAMLGLGLPRPAALALGILFAAVTAWLASRPVAALVTPVLSGRRWLAAAAIAVALTAIVQIGRLSVFTADSARTGYSGSPGDPWRVKHCCMTGYAEAARLAQDGGANIYDAALYQPRQIGPLQVDRYHYPPPFLLPLRMARVVTTDFYRIRMLWFALQAVVLAAAVVWVALWIGGVTGAGALLGGLLVLTAPSAVYALQMGNFQSSAVALSIVGLALLSGARSSQVLRGAALLAFAAVSKIFPGILIVYLLTARRWRATAWVAAAGVALVVVSLAVFGARPWLDFVHHAVPEISDGRAFPQSERPNIAASNTSMYGLTVRLRLLGVQALDQSAGLRIASLYGVLVVVLAAAAGFRVRPDPATARGRVLLARLGLALISLASFRSPFVGGPYGYVASFWLLTLIAADAPTPRARAAWFAGLIVFAGANWLTPSAHYPMSPVWLAISGVMVVAAMAVNFWVILHAIRAAAVGVPFVQTVPVRGGL